MPMEPEHPLKPAFEKAREWAREQKKLLTDRQLEVFEAMKHRQTKEREIRQKWFDGVREQLRDREKKQKAKAELKLNPPVRAPDHETRRLARLAIANEKRLERLDRRHETETVKILQKFEQERANEKSNNLGDAWLKALNKAAQHERDRDRDHAHKRMQERDIDERSR